VVAALIVAAGTSQRMGFDKLSAVLRGQTVLSRSIQAFVASDVIDAIWVVTHADREALITEMTAGWVKVAGVVRGGRERYESVISGLQALPKSVEWVAVHDGARPLIRSAQIAACLAAAREHGAAASARRVTDTMMRADAAANVEAPVPRANLWAMETPQVFRREALLAAYEQVVVDGLSVTDEVTALRHVGQPVRLVADDFPNPKITYATDLASSERWLA
jgi:2-C-methyl-D-erythritol 4-phosphate cytidylyltransferase